jgi:hypothetical protein
LSPYPNIVVTAHSTRVTDITVTVIEASAST